MALIGGKSFIDIKVEKEDKIRSIIDQWSKVEVLIAYKYMRNSCGASMESIDYNIDELIRKEQREGNGGITIP